MKRILVTGALGQIGTELTMALRERYGAENVIASDIRVHSRSELEHPDQFEFIDVTNIGHLHEVIRRYNIDTIYHLAALLSAIAEQKPQVAWEINMSGLYNVLEAARQHRCSVFVPSSIGAFGTGTPPDNTPQDTVQRPTTMYGVTKVAGELLGDYYHHRFGVDVRGLRFPGLISYVAPPGGGTTDYAVEIFYAAVQHKKYYCFLKPDTRMDMMYMPDAIQAVIQLMEADEKNLKHRNAFNVTAMNFTPSEVAQAIQASIPSFTIAYKVDPVRQAIADSWPNSLDDTAAREEWGWSPKFGLLDMTRDMLSKLEIKLHPSRSEH